MINIPPILLERKPRYEYVDMCKDPSDVEAHMETLRTTLRRADERIKELEHYESIALQLSAKNIELKDEVTRWKTQSNLHYMRICDLDKLLADSRKTR